MGKSEVYKVFFNASVILAGLKSPSGGSAKLLKWCKSKRIQGLVSEIIVDEVIRNVNKAGFEKEETVGRIRILFDVKTVPEKAAVEKFKKIVINFGDAHVLASSEENEVDFLVTLDKKHLLILQNKVKKFKIVSPGELIEILSS